MRHQSGFTLIELVVTISVAAILLTLAVPSFRSTIQNNRVTGQANEFLTSLTLARSEAIKRGRNASVCISSDGTSCMGSNWASGWLVWSDNNGNGTLDAGETVRVHEALPTGSTLTELGGATDVQYIADGSVCQVGSGVCPDGSTFTFTLSATGCTGNQERILSINATGQPSVAPAACP